MTITILVLLVIAAAITALIVRSVRRAKARMQGVIAVAQEFGLSPIEKVPWQFGTKVFDLGVNQKPCQPALEGTINGRRILLFDFSYDTGSGEDASTHFMTVAAFAFPGQNLPSFQLGRRSILGRGIEIEGNPEFAKRFRLTGEDQAAIRSLFTPSLVNLLASTELDKQKVALEGAGDWLVFYRGTISAGQCRSFLEQTSQIASGFATHMGSSNSPRSQAATAGHSR